MQMPICVKTLIRYVLWPEYQRAASTSFLSQYLCTVHNCVNNYMCMHVYMQCIYSYCLYSQPLIVQQHQQQQVHVYRLCWINQQGCWINKSGLSRHKIAWSRCFINVYSRAKACKSMVQKVQDSMCMTCTKIGDTYRALQ